MKKPAWMRILTVGVMLGAAACGGEQEAADPAIGTYGTPTDTAGALGTTGAAGDPAAGMGADTVVPPR